MFNNCEYILMILLSNRKIGHKITEKIAYVQKKMYFCRQINVFFNKIRQKMAKKGVFSVLKWGMALLNVCLLVIVSILLIIALIFGLRKYTQHGVEVEVPDVTTMHIAEANIIAQAEGLCIEVIDSTFSRKVPLGTIVEQNPSPGSKVKHGRTIYVVQNARFRRPVILPELRDLSLRQAEATVKSLGLEMGEVIYRPSTFKNIILDVRTCDTSIVAGTRLEEGTLVNLVVGQGQGVKEVNVPHIIGKTLKEANSWLLAYSLTLGSVEYDEAPTEGEQIPYVVYQQMPASGTVVVEGTSVNIKLTTDIEKTITTNYEESNEEDFF